MAKPVLATPEEEPRRSRKRKPAKRRFGRIRQLPSGRFQARYTGPDGVDRPAPETFATKTDAEVWLTRKEAEILDDEWIDPDAGKITLGKYGRDWIDERPNLRLRTVELYGYLFRAHLVPTFDDKALSEIKDPHVRRWRKKLLDAGLPKIHFHDLRHRKHPRGERRGVDPGADGAHGPLQHTGRDDLSALDRRATARGSPQARRPRP
jgi:hypothetical protein